MSIQIQAGHLAAATKQLGPLAAGRGTLPILGHYLLAPSGEGLSLTASDLEIEATIQIPGQIDRPLCLPADQIGKASQALPEGALIQIDPDGQRAKVSSGKSRWSLPMLPPDDYPRITDAPKGDPIALDLPTLQAAIKSAHYAAGVKDVRYFLNGLLLELASGTLTIVGTDGHRMAAVPLPCPGTGQWIIPNSAIGHLLRLRGSQIHLIPCERGLRWQTDSAAIYTKTLDGRYPDWRRVIPAALAHSTQINTADLLAAISRVGIIVTAQNQGLRLDFSPGSLSISTANAEGASASEELAADTQATDTLGLLGRYLAEAIGAIGSDSIRLDHDAEKAVILTAGSSQHIIMPMRT